MKVKILTTVAGAGHNQAARAIAKAFAEDAPMHDAEYIDLSEVGSPLVRKMYNDAYLKLVEKQPALWGYFYDRYDHKKLSATKEKLKSAFAKINSRSFAKKLEDDAPDLLIATHFYPAEIALRLRAKGKLRSKLHVVITDYQPHSFWVLDGTDRYYVADDETKHNLAARGVDPAIITVTGIPVDPKFAARPDRRQLCSKLGLDPAKFTVLLASGGMGVGPIEEIYQALLDLETVPQIMVVSGRNEKLKAALDKIPVPPGKTTKVYGFATNMEELMGAANLIVSKCGGLTTAESLAVGLPMMILHPIPGQEAANADLLLERGVALKANDVPQLQFKLRKLLAEPARIDQMRANIKKLARPFAARDLVRFSVGLPAVEA